VADHGERLARIEGEKRVTHENLGDVYREVKGVDRGLSAEIKKLELGVSSIGAVLARVEKGLEQLEKQVGRMDQFWRSKGE